MIMNIAIIGTGNIGGTLAEKWANKGHNIYLGVRDTSNFKGQRLVEHPSISAVDIHTAVQASEVVVLATPAMLAVEVAQSLGDTTGKIIIDTMNIVMGRGPAGFATTSEAILAHANTRDVVKCFNTTGFNNMQNPFYQGEAIDMFMAGDSTRGKAIAAQLALEVGFSDCHDIGGNDKFAQMEEFARFWINLAMFQGMGRDFAFKLKRR
ncbi:MAG: hypothetical protein RL226_2090 [Bacteroidota bacterium]|jgi:predicted dinucleotide-binding enzyme